MADNFDSDSDTSEFSDFHPSEIDYDLGVSFDDDSGNESDNLDDLLPEPPNANDLWTDNFTTPTIQQFTEDAGPKLPDGFDTSTASPLQYFLLLFPMHLIQLLVTMTNNFHVWKISQPGDDLEAEWQDVTLEEMRAFLAINILMGIHQVQDASIFWKDLVGNAGVMMTMTHNRFKMIMQYLQVSDRATEPSRDQPGYDKLFKVKPVLETLSDTFQRYYTLPREVSVGEAMIPFMGKLTYRQYMRDQPRGIKVWMLCDAKSAYLSRFEVYLGCQPDLTKNEIGNNVVMKLTDRLRHSFRFVFFNKFFTSIPLMKDLLEVGLYACGAVQINRKGFPQALKKPAGVRDRGDFKVLQMEDSNLTATVWKDKKLVYHLTTLSDPQIVMPAHRRSRSTVLNMEQPHSVHSYNQFMGGVHLHKNYRTAYDIGSKGKTSWHYLFWFLLNSSIGNAYIIYESASNRTTRQKRFNDFYFRMELIKELIGGYTMRKRSALQTDNPPLVGVENINGHVHTYMDGNRRRCQ